MIRLRRKRAAIEKEQIDRMAKAVAKLRARGVQVLFVRMPSSGEFLAYENREFPRTRTWVALLAATGAPGIHFEDYPQLQGYYLPEWSHMPLAEGERFTAALYGIVSARFLGAGQRLRRGAYHERRALKRGAGAPLHGGRAPSRCVQEGFFTQPRGLRLNPICTSTSFLPQRQRNRAMMLATGSSQPRGQCRARNAGVSSRECRQLRQVTRTT